jgi:hypothetical protein
MYQPVGMFVKRFFPTGGLFYNYLEKRVFMDHPGGIRFFWP